METFLEAQRSSTTDVTASFIGSGINGNNQKCLTPLLFLTSTASFIGSGINGNPWRGDGAEYPQGVPLPLQEVELMETYLGFEPKSFSKTASFIGSGINGNTPQQAYNVV